MRRDQQRLNDILEALDWIAKAIDGRKEADFLADETLCYAVAQKLTIIGEVRAHYRTGSRASGARRSPSVPTWPSSSVTHGPSSAPCAPRERSRGMTENGSSRASFGRSRRKPSRRSPVTMKVSSARRRPLGKPPLRRG